MDQNSGELVTNRINHGSHVESNSGTITNNFYAQGGRPDSFPTAQDEIGLQIGIRDPARQCHRLFKTTDYEAHKDFNRKRHSGTCEWVLEHPKFLQWQQSSRSLLWFSADAGCGKSVFSRFFVDTNLLIGGQTSPCYFFFGDSLEQNNLVSALCAILHQLFSIQPHLLRHAMLPWEQTGARLPREPITMWRILCTATADLACQPITCVFDAVDECIEPDRRQLFDLLCSFCSGSSDNHSSSSNLKFMVTSRPDSNIERVFKTSGPVIEYFRLRGEEEGDKIRKDIQLIIKERVDDFATEFSLSQESRESLRNDLLQIEHRTLLGLDLILTEARIIYEDSLDPNKVRINSLPSSVEDIYEQLSSKLTGSPKKQTRLILCFVLAALRPLTILELLVAQALFQDSKPLNMTALKKSESHVEKQIRRWCGHLIIVSKSRVFPIHKTVKDFLMGPDHIDSYKQNKTARTTWRHSISILDAHRALAIVCQKAGFASDNFYRQTNSDQDLSKGNSLVHYALEHGVYHMSEAFKRMPDHFSRVFFVHQIPGFGVDLQALDQNGKSLLHYMTHDSQHSINYAAVAFILNRGGLVQSADENRLHCLQYAAIRDDERLLHMLLKAGFGINKTEHLKETSDLTKLELEDHFDPPPSLIGLTALNTAASFGQAVSVSFLLRNKANIKIVDQEGRTVLHRAVRGQHYPRFATFQGAVVRSQQLTSLNHKGFDRDQADNEQFNTVIESNRVKIVNILCRAYPSLINVKDFYGRTPLHGVASANMSMAATNCETLLKYGADPEVRDNEGIAPIHMAAIYGNLDCLKLLMRTDSDIDIIDNYGRTLLHFATICGRWEDFGLDYDERFCHLALEEVDQSAPDPFERIFIRTRTFVHGHAKKVATFLLKKGIQASRTDHEGRDALAYHMMDSMVGQDPELIALLLENGADPFFRDAERRNLAHMLMSSDSKYKLEALVKLRNGGTCPLELDEKGRSILHHLAMSPTVAAQWLLYHLRDCIGIDFALRDIHNKTAQDYASEPKEIPSWLEEWDTNMAQISMTPRLKPPCSCLSMAAEADNACREVEAINEHSWRHLCTWKTSDHISVWFRLIMDVTRFTSKV